MSFFDSINPFKKKEEFAFQPLDSGNSLDMSHQDLDHGHNFEPGSFGANPPGPMQQMPQDDHRMTMPLGENIRQARVAAMYGGNEEGQPAIREHNPLQKDLELISSKLDYLKASLDAINQRLVNLEHITRQEIDKKRW